MDSYIFRDNSILIESDSHMIPDSAVSDALYAAHLLSGMFTDTAFGFRAAELTVPADSSDDNAVLTLPDKGIFIPLREYFAEHTPEQNAIAGRAKGMLNWRIITNYCPACSTKLKDDPAHMARICPACGRQFFPRIEPCIIILINRGNEILLARHKQRNQDIYTCLSGFIEIGESAEQTAVREVREETGLEIQNLHYCASQGWPFPNQLMFAYRAEYKSGEICIQKDELYDAKWFTRENLPQHPKPGSMGYRLIHGEFD